MRDILIVTGTAGVGKSSVCWEWAGRRKGAAIECDRYRTWIRDRSLRVADGFQEALIARHAAALAEDYLEMGLDVAIDNVWTPAGITYLLDSLAGKGRVKVFWLCCSSEENHRRDNRRSPSDVMGGRVDELQDELEQITWPVCVERVDTTGQSLQQTVDELESMF